MHTDPCSRSSKKPLLTLLAALNALRNAIQPITDSETIAINQALGRILASPIHAPMHSPAHRNAAMDGYAFSSHGRTDAPFTLSVAATAYAGRPYTQALAAHQCVRIFTGAVVPETADSVVMQEKVRVDGNTIHFPAQTAFRQNIREIGEDIMQGDCLIATGKKLSAIDIGLLASVGVSDIKVKRRVNIMLFSTGDELVPLGEALAIGQLHDSNRYLLTGLLNDPCYQLTDGGIIADDKQQLETQFLAATTQHDVIISTGGASVGEADYVKDILQQHGTVHFWQLAIKPGKPFAFGQLNGCYFFGLPGNPVAVIATLQQLVLPALQQLMGASSTQTLRLNAICSSNLKKSAGRQDFQRGIFTQNENGEFYVSSAGAQGSHLLVSMSRANCFIVLPINCTGISAGETVIIEPFSIAIASMA